MKYKEFKALRKETKLIEAISSIQDIWYGFAEGYYSLSANYIEYSSLINKLSNQFPSGWEFRLNIDGSFLASRHVSEQQALITIFKEKDGSESINLRTKK